MIETSDEFKKLQQETELKKEYTEKVHDSLNAYIKILSNLSF